MEEIWKDIHGYGKGYKISNFGNVQGKRKMLKPMNTKQGYKVVELRNNNKRKTVKVHRLVAEYFISNPLEKKNVNHIDGDKSNNCINNLEWVTSSENIQHAYNIGLKVPMFGEKHPQHRLNEKDVVEIREIGKSKTLKEIGKMYNVSLHTIHDVLTNRYWKGVR